MNCYHYSELAVGQSESFSVSVTEDTLEQFCRLSGDDNPLHQDADYARSAGFPGRAAYGMLTASFLSTLAGVYLPGKYSLIHSVDIEFPQPVFPGDQLTISGAITEKDDRFQCIYLKVIIRNQKNQKVCRGKMRIGVLQ